MLDARVDRALLFRLATSDAFERIVRRVPGGEARAWQAASRYVAGKSQERALALSVELAQRGIGASLDFFGEQVRDPALARSAVDGYVAVAGELVDLPAGVWLSLDLSHIGFDIDVSFCRRSSSGSSRRFPTVACSKLALRMPLAPTAFSRSSSRSPWKERLWARPCRRIFGEVGRTPSSWPGPASTSGW